MLALLLYQFYDCNIFAEKSPCLKSRWPPLVSPFWPARVSPQRRMLRTICWRYMHLGTDFYICLTLISIMLTLSWLLLYHDVWRSYPYVATWKLVCICITRQNLIWDFTNQNLRTCGILASGKGVVMDYTRDKNKEIQKFDFAWFSH